MILISKNKKQKLENNQCNTLLDVFETQDHSKLLDWVEKYKKNEFTSTIIGSGHDKIINLLFQQDEITLDLLLLPTKNTHVFNGMTTEYKLDESTQKFVTRIHDAIIQLINENLDVFWNLCVDQKLFRWRLSNKHIKMLIKGGISVSPNIFHIIPPPEVNHIYSNEKLVRFILENGGSKYVNAKDPAGATYVEKYCHMLSTDSIRLLEKHGAVLDFEKDKMIEILVKIENAPGLHSCVNSYVGYQLLKKGIISIRHRLVQDLVKLDSEYFDHEAFLKLYFRRGGSMKETNFLPNTIHTYAKYKRSFRSHANYHEENELATIRLLVSPRDATYFLPKSYLVSNGFLDSLPLPLLATVLEYACGTMFDMIKVSLISKTMHEKLQMDELQSVWFNISAQETDHEWKYYPSYPSDEEIDGDTFWNFMNAIKSRCSLVDPCGEVLFFAIQTDLPADIVKKLIRPKHTYFTDPFGRNALHWVALFSEPTDLNALEMAKALISSGVKHLQLDKFGRIPLHYASINGKTALSDFLFGCSPTAYMADNDGRKPCEGIFDDGELEERLRSPVGPKEIIRFNSLVPRKGQEITYPKRAFFLQSPSEILPLGGLVIYLSNSVCAFDAETFTLQRKFKSLDKYICHLEGERVFLTGHRNLTTWDVRVPGWEVSKISLPLPIRSLDSTGNYIGFTSHNKFYYLDTRTNNIKHLGSIELPLGYSRGTRAMCCCARGSRMCVASDAVEEVLVWDLSAEKQVAVLGGWTYSGFRFRRDHRVMLKSSQNKLAVAVVKGVLTYDLETLAETPCASMILPAQENADIAADKRENDKNSVLSIGLDHSGKYLAVGEGGSIEICKSNVSLHDLLEHKKVPNVDVTTCFESNKCRKRYGCYAEAVSLHLGALWFINKCNCIGVIPNFYPA